MPISELDKVHIVFVNAIGKWRLNISLPTFYLSTDHSHKSLHRLCKDSMNRLLLRLEIVVGYLDDYVALVVRFSMMKLSWCCHAFVCYSGSRL